MAEQPARRDPAPPARRRPVAINVQGATRKTTGAGDLCNGQAA